MVKASEVNKDITSIAAKVKTAVFSYDDIHNPDVKNEFHYDYNKVIDEVAKINDWDKDKARKYLFQLSVLSPLPNGEYKVNVGTTTKGGGGVNYHGTAFFSLSNDDYETKYHELAHSLQRKYHLFDAEKIDKLYRSSAKGMDDSEIDDLQIGKTEYTNYLKEMHSESFSYAAMMLRAENPLDFAKQVYKAYNTARSQNMEGIFSFGKTEYGGDNNNSKFYATFPVMKETIKTVLKIRKQGKVKEFFDEKGILKDEKLAKLCEQAVIKSAYSPRTLNAFFKYKFFDGHNSDEHGWRRDAIKSVASALHGSVIYLISDGNMLSKWKSIRRHHKMEQEEKEKINQFANKHKVFNDDETQALYDYIQFNTLCAQVASKYKGDSFLNSSTLYAQSVSLLRYKHKTINEAGNRVQASLLGEKFSRKKKEALSDDMMRLKYFVRDRKDNPYFCHLVQEEPDIATVSKMYQEKLKNPEQKQITAPTPIKLFAEKENPYFAMNGIRRNMFYINDLVSDYKCSKTFAQTLVNLSLKDAETINNTQIRGNLANAVHFKLDIFGIKKRKFKKDLAKTLDRLGDNAFDQLNNLSYEAYKKQFEGMKLEDVLEKTKVDIQEYNKNSKKESKVKGNTSQKTVNQPSEDREKAVQMVNNNLEAMNYLADRYGLSDNLRLQMQKMTVMPTEKQNNQQLRKALIDVVQFNGDWLGSEKHHFKKDFNKLMDSFICDAQYLENNPTYKEVCQETFEQLRQHKTVDFSTQTKQEDTTNQKDKANQSVTAKVIPINESIEQKKTPKEMVIDKLKSLGIEEGTYLVLTPEDKAFTNFGYNETRSIQSYFDEGKKDIKETGASVVYGSNNGLVGAYFKEGVYVVSKNEELRRQLYYTGKDVGFGVLLSNGEHFNHEDGRPNAELNAAWTLASYKAEKANEKSAKEAEERALEIEKAKKAREVAMEKSGVQSVCDTLKKITEVADKYDVSGKLKDKLVTTYIKESDKMLTLEFWGECAKEFGGKDVKTQGDFVQKLGTLGLEIGKDIKQNRDNQHYQNIKNKCRECQTSQEMIKTANAGAKRLNIDLSDIYSVAASR